MYFIYYFLTLILMANENEVKAPATQPNTLQVASEVPLEKPLPPKP